MTQIEIVRRLSAVMDDEYHWLAHGRINSRLGHSINESQLKDAVKVIHESHFALAMRRSGREIQVRRVW